MTVTITGTGFSTTPSSNTVIIGTSGTCTVTSASATSLICTISAAPAGSYGIQVNVAGKGLATGTSGSSVTVTLQLTSISPIQGGAGEKNLIDKIKNIQNYSFLLQSRWWLYIKRNRNRIFLIYIGYSRWQFMYKSYSN
jgi:hypothetical protein